MRKIYKIITLFMLIFVGTKTFAMPFKGGSDHCNMQLHVDNQTNLDLHIDSGEHSNIKDYRVFNVKAHSKGITTFINSKKDNYTPFWVDLIFMHINNNYRHLLTMRAEGMQNSFCGDECHSPHFWKRSSSLCDNNNYICEFSSWAMPGYIEYDLTIKPKKVSKFNKEK